MRGRWHIHTGDTWAQQSTEPARGEELEAAGASNVPWLPKLLEEPGHLTFAVVADSTYSRLQVPGSSLDMDRIPQLCLPALLSMNARETKEWEASWAQLTKQPR